MGGGDRVGTRSQRAKHCWEKFSTIGAPASSPGHRMMAPSTTAFSPPFRRGSFAHDGRMRVHRLLAALVLVAVVGGGGASPGVPATDAWQWPVTPHRVVRGYEAPATPYSAGHRGIDLAVQPGQQVVAPAAGVVSFAGVVVDRPLVSVQLPGGLLATLEPVQPTVRTGERVEAGDVVGVVATGGHCTPGCLHLGSRVRGAYVSPLRFLVGIPRAVLLPMDSTPASFPGQARG